MIAPANTSRRAENRNANGAAKSAADEMRRADAAVHRYRHCVNEPDKRQALTAAIDHAGRALVLLRSI